MEEPPMQRLIVLALSVFALAAVPAALADDGTTTTPPATGSPAAAGQAHGKGLEILRLRMQLVELRFAKHCGANADGADQRCLDFAKKVEDRLTKLDGNVQTRIAKIQSTCAATSTDEKCKHAADRIALLQKVDARVKALAQKVQDWLDGKTVTTDPNSDSSLDQAAAGLGKLTQQAGANG
jgi:predicted outer membrane protein